MGLAILFCNYFKEKYCLFFWIFKENECKKLECDLQRISKAKDKVVAESEASYLEPFQVNIQFAKVVAK